MLIAKKKGKINKSCINKNKSYYNYFCDFFFTKKVSMSPVVRFQSEMSTVVEPLAMVNFIYIYIF